MHVVEHTLRMSIQWSENVKWILLGVAALLFLASFTLFVIECVGEKKKNALLLMHTPTEVISAAEQTVAVAEEAVEGIPVEEVVEETIEEVPIAVVEKASAEEEHPVLVPSLAAEESVDAVEDDATMASESFLVNGKAIYVRYDRSFRARLIQSSDEIKARYSELKNLLLSYGTKARISWTNETFRFGRQTVAKFGIKGKTLSLYLALTPADYEQTKYSFENVGDVKRYVDVPMRLKLRSARSVKWAAELIVEMMAKLGKEQKAIEAENFAPDYETTEALVYQALIKVLATGDGMEGELTPATFEAMRREKFKQLQAEAPVVEEANEEVLAEEIVEEAAAEVAKEEAPAIEEAVAAVEDDATMASESFLVNGKAIYVRYDRSFRARLIQSADEIKARYSELKNLLLSYGTKARISWTNETFRFGRQTVAKFGIKGKTLSLYLALTPADYEQTKYSFENVGDVKRYVDVPMRLKLRSARSVKWAAELIVEMMAKLGKEQKAIEAENFAPDYETTEALVYQALIKVLATGDGMEGELTPATFEAMRREKFKQLQAEAPVVEEANEEVLAEEIVEEAAAEVAEEEAPAMEEAVAAVEDDATMASESFLVNGKAIYVRYDRSFRARLIQSADEIKARYSELKNLLLSYGTKARISWTNETFRFGRQTVAKFGIKGKTLSLYLALTPADYEQTKYSFENVGDVKRYVDVPMRLKLRSARSVKWAAELIVEMMAKMGKEQKAIEAENFAPDYETTEALVYQALIKVLATGDGMEGELTPATFEDMRREKFQQMTGIAIQESVAAEDAESILDDELAASFIEDEEDLEDDVEEIEIINEDEEDTEQAYAKETPAAEEALVTPVLTAAPVAVAKSAPRIKKNVKKAEKKGTKEIVNIDAISRAFAAGDKVTLEALKDKRLITRRAGFVKILARGRLDKSLTVVADEFSIQAVKMILLTGGRVVRRNKHR